MSKIYDDIVSQRGTLENLIAKIPGFKGYHEKQARRNADDMLRDYIAAEIGKRVDEFERVEKLILNNMGMSYMTRTRDLKGKIRLFQDQVSSSTPGYSGMWGQMKIGNEELEKIYAFDEAIIVYVERLDEGLAGLKEAATKKEGLDEAIVVLDDQATDAMEAYSLRGDVLTEFAQ